MQCMYLYGSFVPNYSIIKFFIDSQISKAPESLFFSIPLESANLKKGNFSDEKYSIFCVVGFPNPIFVSTFKTSLINVDFPTPDGPTNIIFKCSIFFIVSLYSSTLSCSLSTINFGIFSFFFKKNLY